MNEQERIEQLIKLLQVDIDTCLIPDDVCRSILDIISQELCRIVDDL